VKGGETCLDDELAAVTVTKARLSAFRLPSKSRGGN
jgi:hypothetical protein